MIKKTFFIFIVFIFGLNLVYSSSQVIDVDINEYIYETVSYNPLLSGSGIWYDNYENQSNYNLYGEINISNLNSVETIYSVYLNFSNFTGITNLTFQNGYTSFVNENSTSLSVYIPELPPNSWTFLNYTINTSLFSPPLNLTSNYSDVSVLTRGNFIIQDNIGNYLDSSFYSDNCVYNVSLEQRTNSFDLNTSVVNFTFESGSIGGLDSSNVTLVNDRYLQWDLYNGGCIYSSNETNIFYQVNVPNITIQDTYSFMNSTIYYSLNSSLSGLSIDSNSAILNLNNTLRKRASEWVGSGEAIWEVYGKVQNPSNITINLESVSFWVSTRNSLGGGFTNPADIDSDSQNNETLLIIYTPNSILNSTTGSWDNDPSFWNFNYSLTSSPIVWMDLESTLLDDGIQFGNSKFSYSNDKLYIKQIYVATGYWLELTKDITRLSDETYNIKINLKNLGSSQTPSNQVVLVYNFLPNNFNLESSMVSSTSTWYTTDTASKAINEVNYNGTMYQFALTPTNIYNSSLDANLGSLNSRNTWSVTYNVSGSGEFNLEDLFLAGVDPLQVEGYGGSDSLTSEAFYGVEETDTFGYVLVTFVVVLGILTYVF